MEADELLATMHDEGVVAVLRSSSVTQAVEVARACERGGVHFIEVTFSVPDAADAIRSLAKSDGGDRATVGAGTVLSAVQAQSAIDAGAEFIVAPTYSPEVLSCCEANDVPYIPGCMTVNEMMAAHRAGCQVVKFFPASEFSPGFIKAVHGPLPQLNIMPTGGIGLENAADWIRAGAHSLGIGGNLTKLDETGLDGIAERAREYLEIVGNARMTMS